jgi:Protein of unknown function (DUF3592)
MGAFVIDFIVIFLWRAVARIFLLAKSSKWKRHTAVVSDVVTPPARTPGAFVEISYRFSELDRQFGGVSKVPFLVWSSAEQYARTMRSSTSITVRVDPANPERSVFFSQDQYA